MVALARVRQQQEEQLALDQFRRVSGLLPGTASRGADPPDFIIANGAQRTSVEATAFHKGSAEKGGSKEAADESNAQQLNERAQTIFEAAHPDVHVEVRPFLVKDRIARRELDHYAELIARAVADRVPPVPEHGHPLTRVDLAWEDLPEAVASVLPHVSIARWRRAAVDHPSQGAGSAALPRRIRRLLAAYLRAMAGLGFLRLQLPEAAHVHVAVRRAPSFELRDLLPIRDVALRSS